MDRRRYSTMLVLAAAALVAEACSSSSGNKGTGGADGGSSSGGATGTGGKADAGTGGMGTGGKVDAGTGGMGTGGKVDAGDGGTGGMGTGGKVDAGDSGTDTPTDTAMDMSLNVDTGADADPAAREKALCRRRRTCRPTSHAVHGGQFCTLYFSICNDLGGVTHFANQAECETAYNGYNIDPDADAGMSPSGQKGCRSHHLCLANNSGVNASLRARDRPQWLRRRHRASLPVSDRLVQIDRLRKGVLPDGRTPFSLRRRRVRLVGTLST